MTDKERIQSTHDTLQEVELTIEGMLEELEGSASNDLDSLKMESLTHALTFVSYALKYIVLLEDMYEPLP